MSIKSIEIKGYRSIADLKIDISRITTFIGQNGSGKSNILSALKFFYRNLTEQWDEENIFDTNNFFHNEIRIKITYNMSNILRIAYHQDNKNHSTYEKYYNKIKAISHNDMIALELIKRKGKAAIWNVGYNTRQIIAALFPMYFVDARQIELTDWTDIWDLIGDLVKLQYDESEEIQKKITGVVKDTDQKLADKILRVQGVLQNRGINVKKMTSRQLGKIISEITLGGRTFQYKSRRLNEFSNGTNAYNYTIFLMDILSLMKQYKLKEPIVVLDEPEISLHIGMVDRLMNHIFSAITEIQFFISTHSSRCVKNLLEQEETDFGIYHVALQNHYSQLRKIKPLSSAEIREHVVVSETYTNSCFAKMVLSVEGETELEVFKNKYLREVFPELKMIEIVTGMSNQIVYNLSAPDKRNYQTPGLSVIDMDKVLVKRQGVNRFVFKPLKGYPTEKETYFYGEKRRNTLYLRKRIQRMCEMCNFYYKLPFYSCDDENFQCLLELISEYYRSYNVFIWHNTIEGALITGENLPEFLRYMETILRPERMDKIWDFLQIHEENVDLNYVRLIFPGKCDYLLTKKQIAVENAKIRQELFDTLCIVPKTCGWVSSWLEYYFLGKAGIDRNMMGCFGAFKKYVSDETNRSSLRLCLKADFRELYIVLDRIGKMVTPE